MRKIAEIEFFQGALGPSRSVCCRMLLKFTNHSTARSIFFLNYSSFPGWRTPNALYCSKAADALNQTKAWDKAGVALHLVDMGGQTLNTASAMGRFFLNMMAGFAELERNLIAERTSLALAHKKAHREAYSPTPLGYNREGDTLAENPQELKTVAQIREWRAAGWTLGKIAGELTRRQVPTKRGGGWYPATVKYLLENNLYAGVA